MDTPCSPAEFRRKRHPRNICAYMSVAQSAFRKKPLLVRWRRKGIERQLTAPIVLISWLRVFGNRDRRRVHPVGRLQKSRHPNRQFCSDTAKFCALKRHQPCIQRMPRKILSIASIPVEPRHRSVTVAYLAGREQTRIPLILPPKRPDAGMSASHASAILAFVLIFAGANAA